MSKTKAKKKDNQDKIDLGISKLLNPIKVDYQLEFDKKNVVKKNACRPRNKKQFPRISGEETSELGIVKATQEASSPLKEDSLVKTTCPKLDQLFNQKKWSELSDVTQEMLTRDSNNFLIKSFWTYANLKLDIINPEILTISLDKKLAKIAVDDPDLDFYRLVATEAASSVANKSPEMADSLTKIFNLQKDEETTGDVSSEVEPEMVPNDLEVAISDNSEFVFGAGEDQVLATEKVFSENNRKLFFPVIILLLVLGLGFYLGSFTTKSTVASGAEVSISSPENLRTISADQEIVINEPVKVIDTASDQASEDKVEDPSPLNDLLEELDDTTADITGESGEVVAQNLQKDSKDSQGLKLETVNTEGPLEPEAVRQVINGTTPSNTSRTQQPVESIVKQGQATKDEYIKGDIVIVKGRSALYHKPSTYSAELMQLLPRDRLQVIKQEGEWLKVNAFDRVNGYIRQGNVD